MITVILGKYFLMSPTRYDTDFCGLGVGEEEGLIVDDLIATVFVFVALFCDDVRTLCWADVTISSLGVEVVTTFGFDDGGLDGLPSVDDCCLVATDVIIFVVVGSNDDVVTFQDVLSDDIFEVVCLVEVERVDVVFSVVCGLILDFVDVDVDDTDVVVDTKDIVVFNEVVGWAVVFIEVVGWVVVFT